MLIYLCKYYFTIIIYLMFLLSLASFCVIVTSYPRRLCFHPFIGLFVYFIVGWIPMKVMNRFWQNLVEGAGMDQGTKMKNPLNFGADPDPGTGPGMFKLGEIGHLKIFFCQFL